MAKSDHTKNWFQRDINQAAINRARDVISREGMALPCVVTGVSGSLVTVSFEVDSTPYTLPQITIPKAESPYFRQPTQIGDTGITIPSDVYIGFISGMSSELPKIGVQPGNLSALIFVPVSNKNDPPSDQNAAIVQGPDGAIMRTLDGTVSIVLNSSGITMTLGSKVVALTSAGLTIDGILFDTHHHTGVSTGGGNTGGPA